MVSIINNKVLDLLNTIANTPKLPVTEYGDRYFIRLNDDQDIRIIKDTKTLIISKLKAMGGVIKDLPVQLTDEEYDTLLKIFKK